MRLRIIGYWGAYPGQQSATSCYLLEEDGVRVLIDAGSGAAAQLQRYIGLNEIDAAVISHFHHDHIADLGVLTYSRAVDQALGNTAAPLRIYASDDETENLTDYSRKGTKVDTYHKDETLTIGPFKFQFQRTKHPVSCYAMKITSTASQQSIVYTADTAFSTDIAAFAENCSILIAETSFYNRQDAASFGHMTSLEAGKLARIAGAGELILSHLPHFGDHQQLLHEAEEEFSGPVSLASEIQKELIFD
ncbi:MBL fold metallo-hydrolase [Salisediminibacterium halotolerans]|uniref:MBL fold metallo-hydrolase n=1 Tax=Salisediminibacterium halotolerans TaxID=517425 RepID=UPI000EB39252|nr:MBL fold metallo-hydrolase [Salisediminibacterium halotolerans]RLJ81077.1 ribonuclease BN (tRNA processing enzyme) [Actinophytocola xinjiangensis]RPE84114.1 ribonuclease BN (tRNA processing enzyme) [Salisediminibacterium halotolerans]TWG38504.1 ribonuclease BN (tRNA processing enzyme) [Salisediminibacterium halotolerans]GEL08664.1 hypothetical protein SHA02_20800 [Salisediminibacterium halotolerans]